MDDESILDEEDTQKDKYLVFTIGQEVYGIDIKVVMEIIGILPITGVPEVPDYIRGIINLRGKIIPVVDMRLRFGQEYREYTDRTCVIVIEVEDMLIGLIIDAVSEVLDIPEADVVPPPKLRESKTKYIRGVGKLKPIEEGASGRVVLLLDWKKLFSKEDAEKLSDMQEQSDGGNNK